ncbi:class E sortase [Streptomyces sp. NPDC049577]|uniref:class E sortase n=1 Tax=Streptomyces sp. NPDC049577 TaxID=3155153 RepID=UPI00342ED6A5
MRLVVRTLSELCVTAGALIVLFVGYVLYWTGVRADHAMDAEIGKLQDRWSTDAPARPGAPDPAPGGDPYRGREQQGAPDRPQAGAGTGEPDASDAGQGGEDTVSRPSGPSTGPEAGARGAGGAPGRRDGAAFAVMYIPRLGSGWAKPVLQGTGTELLKRGLGHYADTAGLGETGNFAVAGHRRTYGDPFKDLPRLRPGDAVVLTDGADWFTYRVDTLPYRTLPGDTGVIDPVPAKAGYRGPGRYLTLTTCDPEWGHSHRLIVWAHLADTRPVGRGKPDALPG